jgi:hypothetical protein
MPSDINRHFHCRKCLEERPKGVSAMDWQSIEVGLTKEGFFQVWCKRHDMNVVTTEEEMTIQ